MRKSIALIATLICLNGCATLAGSAVGAAAAGFGQGAAQALFGDSE